MAEPKAGSLTVPRRTSRGLLQRNMSKCVWNSRADMLAVFFLSGIGDRMSIDVPPPRRARRRVERCDLSPIAPVDQVLLEAQERRARRLDGLLGAGGRRVWHILVSLVARVFGWNRRAVPARASAHLGGGSDRLAC
jgi:hypothetical protein